MSLSDAYMDGPSRFTDSYLLSVCLRTRLAIRKGNHRNISLCRCHDHYKLQCRINGIKGKSQTNVGPYFWQSAVLCVMVLLLKSLFMSFPPRSFHITVVKTKSSFAWLMVSTISLTLFDCKELITEHHSFLITPELETLGAQACISPFAPWSLS